MAGLKELRTRLNAVKSTKKITTAMKLVAAAKLKKAVSAMEKNSFYATLVGNAVARVLLEYKKEEIQKKSDTCYRRYFMKPQILKIICLLFFLPSADCAVLITKMWPKRLPGVFKVCCRKAKMLKSFVMARKLMIF